MIIPNDIIIEIFIKYGDLHGDLTKEEILKIPIEEISFIDSRIDKNKIIFFRVTKDNLPIIRINYFPYSTNLPKMLGTILYSVLYEKFQEMRDDKINKIID